VAHSSYKVLEDELGDIFAEKSAAALRSSG
jgi:hypothetical protein